jgi:hypothetical protein
MLNADKQVLDARLRNEMQQLRRLEITNVVNRFQNALTPATLIAGFSFTALTDLEITEGHKLPEAAITSEPVFYICSTLALALSLYVTAVSTMGIVFGQRLTIQATAEQGYEHDATVRELNSKFVSVLVALGISMVSVVGAAICVVIIKDPTEHHGSYVSKITSIVVVVLFLTTVFAMGQMFWRLHTPTPQSAKIVLRAGKGKSVAEVPEFYVGSEPPVTSGLTKRSSGSGSPSSEQSGTAPGVHYRKEAGTDEERSSLVGDLMCLDREKHSD